MEKNYKSMNAIKVGIYSAWLLAIFALLTFILALIAVPPSGPYCPGNCMNYPYPDILTYFPRDYYWMYLVVIQLCLFLILMIANHFNAPVEKKIYTLISVAFAIISTTILLADYFLQFSVIPISVMKDQTDGIALLTQYNGHGIFIALEELGYSMMSIAFLFLSPAYTMKNRLEKVLHWVLLLPFILNTFAFIYYSVQFGLDRDYRFEVATLSINWLASIISGILLGIFYRRKIKEIEEAA
ncbi:hypothetical protein [Leptolinea tardivitalis]|uniref:Uncharacterized protein n=1 Tax=Leptolinea tardivitalis TaxID=229920 RepID=A0A0P6WS72_9CHLR|nr:hypothetical protein [Leptolinea tardivitalis]KPL72968.1 hypothetical protein ADM99_08035 [Leptolinea tardivitalis]GAP20629.1 hypothetical protein LTAR_00823 [Leptolinea tardivitalis]